jgi:hypothetical protein
VCCVGTLSSIMQALLLNVISAWVVLQVVVAVLLDKFFAVSPDINA